MRETLKAILALIVFAGATLGVYAIGAVTLMASLIVGGALMIVGAIGVTFAVIMNIIRGPRR